MVDPTMLSFFQPAAEKVMSSADPAKAMAAALAALSGIKEIPKPRSLLAQVPPAALYDHQTLLHLMNDAEAQRQM